MIDFHTHILPNIDDGARNIEETIALIKEAKEAGFDEIILTSHYIENYYETDVPERDMWVKAISDNLKSKGIETNLYLGNEIYISDNMMQLLIDGKASTITSCPEYILMFIEFSFVNFFKFSTSSITSLYVTSNKRDCTNNSSSRKIYICTKGTRINI